jgi:excisionase family DNA binding protein
MPNPDRIPHHISVLESLSHEHFTAEELAKLLGVSVPVIVAAVRRGELDAYTVDHRIVDIKRSDALKWLNERRNS